MPQANLKTLLLIFISFSFSVSSSAQDSTKKRVVEQIIKINLPDLVLGRYEMALEIPTGPGGALQLSGGLIKRNRNGNTNSRPYDINRTGFTGTLQYKSYENGRAPQGIYFSPFISFEKVTAEFIDNTLLTNFNLSHSRKETVKRGGILLGHQMISDKGYTLDIYIGPYISNKKITTEYNIDALNEPVSTDDASILGDKLFEAGFPKLDLDKDNFQIERDFGTFKGVQIGLKIGVSIGFAF